MPEKQALKEMTDEDRELLDLFQKFHQIPQPVDEATGPIGIPGANMASEMADEDEND